MANHSILNFIINKYLKNPYLLFLSSKNGYGVIESLTKKENMHFKHQKTIAYVDKNVDKKSPVMRP